MIWWRRKSKVNQHRNLIIAAVKCWDAKAAQRWFVFRFGKHEMCPTLEKKYIELGRYPVMSFFDLEKDDLERADDL